MTAKSKARTNLINSIEMFPQNDAAFKLLKDMLIEYIEKDIEYNKLHDLPPQESSIGMLFHEDIFTEE